MHVCIPPPIPPPKAARERKDRFVMGRPVEGVQEEGERMLATARAYVLSISFLMHLFALPRKFS